MAPNKNHKDATRKARKAALERLGIETEECLGKIAERYGHRCSQECDVTSLCSLVSMGAFLRRGREW